MPVAATAAVMTAEGWVTVTMVTMMVVMRAACQRHMDPCLYSRRNLSQKKNLSRRNFRPGVLYGMHVTTYRLVLDALHWHAIPL